MSARYQSQQNASSTTSLGAQLAIYNQGSASVDLADLHLRYYLTNEVAAQVNTSINYAYVTTIPSGGQTPISSAVQASLVAMAAPKSYADSYLEFGFNASAGTLTPSHSVLLSWSTSNSAAQAFTQTNDYSFSSSQTTSGDYAKVVLLHGTCVIWGNPP